MTKADHTTRIQPPAEAWCVYNPTRGWLIDASVRGGTWMSPAMLDTIEPMTWPTRQAAFEALDACGINPVGCVVIAASTPPRVA